MASVVRGLCGSAAGWSRGGGSSRRGSTIVLVVSSLALFAVITVAYVGLGIGDRRTGAVTIARDQVDDVAVKVRDYLVDVIGRDAIAVFVEEGPGGERRVVREAWDYPWTDPNRRSVPSPQQLRFDPAGSMSRDVVDAARVRGVLPRPYPGSDPWLASTEPSWLPRISGGTVAEPSDPYYLDMTSWWQISNFAPDGRFVNLHALRGRQGTVWSGNFDAEPGIGTDGNGNPRMSERLILLDDQGQSTATTLHGVTADKNIPAHWNMFQQGAARPVGPGRDGSGLSQPGSPTFAPYSWVDTDGDGILDARWFELVDATDPQNIISLLPQDSRWRWFVAARAVDLSSKVNVNTARDVSTDGAPTASRPIGNNPGDVDLLRLLTGEDEFALNPGSEFYGEIHQPVDPGSLARYTDYATTPVDAARIGHKAYLGLLEGARTGLVPPADREYGFVYPRPPEFRITAAERQQAFVAGGATKPGGARLHGPSGRAANSAGFGIQDLVELLTYHGLNDPHTTSRLERMAGGRETTTPQFSPLRDNRPLEVERLADVGPNPLTPNPDGLLDRQRLALLAMNPRGRLTTISGAAQRRSSTVPFSAAAELPSAIASIQSDESPTRMEIYDAMSRATRFTGSDPSVLFAVYAGALLPAAGETGAWTEPEYRTMFYGHDRLFALRAAAHMTVNRIDSWDTASEGAQETPTAVTLRIRGDATLDGNPDFPWWNEPAVTVGGVQVYPGRLDLEPDPTVEMLPRGSGPAAVNVYGIEPQPFLVEAASLIMYTDTHVSDGGDQEWEEITGPGGEVTIIPAPATINGSVSVLNEDFLFQAVAFQLSNPFDESISLANYRIEFGSREYNLNEEGGEVILLAPRESVVVYYLSQDKDTIRSRLISSAYEAAPGAFDEAVNEWIQYQFRGGAAAEGLMRTVELTREGTGIGGLNQVDLLAGPHGDPLTTANRSVLLWRGLETASGDRHDMLVDRLRDPAAANGRPTLDRRLPTGQNDIAGTLVGPPPDPDDEGLSLTLWGSIRRAEDPRASEGAVENLLPRGGLPAWCLESRFGSGRGGQLNIAETDDFTPQSLTKADFDRDGESRLDSLMRDQTGGVGGNPSRLIDTLRLEPWAKATGMDRALSTTDQEAQIPYWSSGADGLDPELHVGPQELEAIRLGDMLMAMAVGPVEDPQDPAFLASGREEDKWTTLSESLALALGYDEVQGVPPGGPVLGGSEPITGPPAYLWYKTDRGFLRLDDYTPFYDGDSDGIYDPSPGSQDVLRGDGIPMALSVLDAFRPSFGTGDSEQFGSLTNPTTGVININTAPLPVLRTLGILSPTTSPRAWLQPGSVHDARSDVAATIAAYRDKTAVYPRDLVGGTSAPISFFSSTTSRGPADPQDLDGRSERFDDVRWAAGQPLPIREQPGFRSLGELMLARDLTYAGAGAADAPHDIDRFAVTGAITADGIESFRYRDAGGERRPDALARDYDEKLAIFNSVAAKISVRSDLYAVWFVLHGYQREDTEGLTDEDPLIPSVAKRFLIIVDRSNVTSEGERPQILHFQELPL